MSDETAPCDVDGCDFVAEPRGKFTAAGMLTNHKAVKHGIRSESPQAVKRREQAKRRRARAAAERQAANAVAGESPLPGLDAPDPEAPVENAPGHGRPIDSTIDVEPVRRGWRSRLWNRPPPAPAKRGRPPKRKREPTADLLGMLWGGAGWGAMKLGDVPVGRAMQFQAAAAGPILERATQDTPIDLLLQPLARNAEAWRDAGALLALPVFVAIMERSPELAVVLEPLLRDVILTNAAAIVPVMERRARDEAKRADALERLGIGGVDQILDAIFGVGPTQAAGPHDEGPAANAGGAGAPFVNAV